MEGFEGLENTWKRMRGKEEGRVKEKNEYRRKEGWRTVKGWREEGE